MKKLLILCSFVFLSISLFASQIGIRNDIAIAIGPNGYLIALPQATIQVCNFDVSLSCTSPILTTNADNGGNYSYSLPAGKYLEKVSKAGVPAYTQTVTISAPQVNADWNATSGVEQILHIPTVFPPASHTHSESEVTNLTNDLALKAPSADAYLTGVTNVQQVRASGPLLTNDSVVVVPSENNPALTVGGVGSNNNDLILAQDAEGYNVFSVNSSGQGTFNKSLGVPSASSGTGNCAPGATCAVNLSDLNLARNLDKQVLKENFTTATNYTGTIDLKTAVANYVTPEDAGVVSVGADAYINHAHWQLVGSIDTLGVLTFAGSDVNLSLSDNYDLFGAAPAAGYHYETTVRLQAAINNQVKVGICRGASGGCPNGDNRTIYFVVTNTGTPGTWSAKVCKTTCTTVTLSGSHVADTLPHTFGIDVSTTLVTLYIDGVSVGTSSTNIIETTFSPFWYYMNTSGTQAAPLDLGSWRFGPKGIL